MAMRGPSRLDIDRIAFIGRTYAEYVSIFGLEESALSAGPVLDCPAGPSSFAAEAHRLGYDVTACDISYSLPVQALLEKGRNDILHVFEKFDEASHLYAWTYYSGKDEVIALRRQALELFTADFRRGYEEGRYRQVELPGLPFSDGRFRLVLSSHFLFLYSGWLGFDFHLDCLKELLRVSSEEVRVFPLCGLDGRLYPRLDEVVSFLGSLGVEVETTTVPFEFQRGCTRMLTLRK
jgi:hypothetical protein